MKFNFFKVLIFFFILSLFGFFFYFDLDSYIQFDTLVKEKNRFLKLYDSYPFYFVLSFLFFYIFYTTFSLPGTFLLTLLSGFLFKFVLGSLIVILGSLTGATFSFLISRYILKDYVQNKFSSHFLSINKGFKKNGLFYLLSLRLIPAIPFFLVNILMAMTSISLKHYILGSFLGMLPAIFLYVNVGQKLANLESVSDILSFPILLSFLLLAFVPWLMKYILTRASKTLGK
ncbi:MAG: TVP38/TMEM64 family protein [Bdellovibrionales bacterium]|nr:TVP38/TMEM64 family protein [Bdellovibrionales bacterium]